MECSLLKLKSSTSFAMYVYQTKHLLLGKYSATLL